MITLLQTALPLLCYFAYKIIVPLVESGARRCRSS
jgi:hypothetical protein